MNKGLLAAASLVAVAVYSLAVVGVLYIVGVIGSPGQGPSAIVATPLPSLELPRSDVPGQDFSTLPRFPGSVRTEYTEEQQGPWHVTEVEYFADVELDEARSYYRRVFREHGWEILSVDYSLGEWIFAVDADDVRAIVEIEPRYPLMEIEIETEVLASSMRDAPPSPSNPVP